VLPTLPTLAIALMLPVLAVAQNPVLDAARQLPLRSGRADSPVVFGFRDGKSTVLVEFERGLARGTVDGVPLPAERLVHWQDRWFVIDATGGVAADITLAAGGGTLRTHLDRGRVTVGLTVVGPSPEKILLYDLSPREALEVVKVREDGPAFAAGLQPGDVLVALDDRRQVTRTALREAITGRRVGESIAVRFLRGGEERTTSLSVAHDFAAYVRDDPAAAASAEGVDGRDWVAGATGMLRPKGGGPVVLVPAAESELHEQVERLESRLVRMEALLERLLERQLPVAAPSTGSGKD